MSFEETRWDIEQTVIEPLRDFRRQVAPLNQLHNDCVNQFATIVGSLLSGSDGAPAFQGQGALAMADKLGMFLDGEEQLCGSGDELIGRLLDAATIGEKRAQELEQRLNEIATEQDHTVEMLSGAALTVDGGAVVQGGVDVPWDIVALGLTGVAALAAATRNLDALKVRDAEDARSLGITMWGIDMESGPNTEPLNRLPPDPKGPSGDFSGFLKMMGITIGAAGVVLAAGAIIVDSSTTSTSGPPVDPQRNLSGLSQSEWGNLKRYLNQKYGCTANEIQDIVNKLGKKQLTAQQLETILQVLQVQAQMQGVLDQMAGNNTPGANRLRAMLEGDMNAIDDDMKYNTGDAGHPLYKWSQKNLNTWMQHVSSTGFEWEAVQALGEKNITGFEVRHPGLDGQVDFETADGTWYESKNEGTINEQGLVEQLEKYAQAGAPALGIVVPADTPKNIGWLLLQRLRNRGITRYGSVKVMFEPPYNPLKPSGWCSIPDQNYSPPSK